MNGLGPKQSIFISHTSKLVIELLVKNKLILFWVLKPFGMTAFPIIANAFCVITFYIKLFTGNC